MGIIYEPAYVTCFIGWWVNIPNYERIILKKSSQIYSRNIFLELIRIYFNFGNTFDRIDISFN
jgi:hypothetical protein